jgi:hypothetical protein
MKIALCLSGGLRGFGHAFKTWDWLLPQISRVFFCCPPPQPGETRIEELIPEATGYYAEDDPWVARQIRGTTEHLDGTLPGNTVSPAQACATMNAINLAWQDGQEAIVRCRPDNHFFSRVSLESLLGVNPWNVWVPERFSWGGACDRFAVGMAGEMRHYAQFYYHIHEWQGDGRGVWDGNQETRLAHHLGHRIQRFNLEFCQVLADGTLRNNQPHERGEFHASDL